MRMDAELRWIHASRRRCKPGGCGPAVARIQSLIYGHGLDGLLPYAAMGNLQKYALWASQWHAAAAVEQPPGPQNSPHTGGRHADFRAAAERNRHRRAECPGDCSSAGDPFSIQRPRSGQQSDAAGDSAGAGCAAVRRRAGVGKALRIPIVPGLFVPHRTLSASQRFPDAVIAPALCPDSAGPRPGSSLSTGRRCLNAATPSRFLHDGADIRLYHLSDRTSQIDKSHAKLYLSNAQMRHSAHFYCAECRVFV